MRLNSANAGLSRSGSKSSLRRVLRRVSKRSRLGRRLGAETSFAGPTVQGAPAFHLCRFGGTALLLLFWLFAHPVILTRDWIVLHVYQPSRSPVVIFTPGDLGLRILMPWFLFGVRVSLAQRANLLPAAVVALLLLRRLLLSVRASG